MKTYDLKKEQQLRLTDVFKPNYEKTVTRALEVAFRKQHAIKEDEPLENILDDDLFPTDNFCLTPNGFVFSYTPGLIANTAEGEIRIFVPSEAVKEFLK